GKVDTARPRIQCIPIPEGCKTYTELYKKSYKLIHKFFFYDLKDWHEAEDVTQDVFTAVYTNLFQCQERVDVLPKSQRENLTYHVKNTIWSVRSNRNTVQNRKIDSITESVMFVNPNITETPLEAAVNNTVSLVGPYAQVRIRNFVEDVKSRFKHDPVGDAMLYIFFGCSHDEAQKKAGISHGSFYRSFKQAKSGFAEIVDRHFDTGEYNGAD
ncbi:UNVERIFIED_CONTAM: hypothetical protein RF648_19385, partial [Kocuria sp. CPCC 205274]